MKTTTTISRSVSRANRRGLAPSWTRPRQSCGAVFLPDDARHRSNASRATLLNPSLLLADFNGDGIPDVLVPSPASSSFTLTLGSVPFGTFSTVSKSVPYPAGCTSVVTNGTVIGDFNGDTLADIALTCDGANASITTYVLLGAGDGSFTVSATLPGLPNLAAGDFNHDGKLDLVEVGPNGNQGENIYFFAGVGDGTFGTQATTAIQSTAYSSVLALDLNNDGYPDLVLGNFAGQTANTLDIYGNNQDGTFGVAGDLKTPTASIAVGVSPASNDVAVLAGNFFGTGLPDLAIVDIGTAPGVFIVQNNSTDGFSFGTANKTAVAGLTGAAAASFTSNFSDLLVSTATNAQRPGQQWDRQLRRHVYRPHHRQHLDPLRRSRRQRRRTRRYLHRRTYRYGGIAGGRPRQRNCLRLLDAVLASARFLARLRGVAGKHKLRRLDPDRHPDRRRHHAHCHLADPRADRLRDGTQRHATGCDRRYRRRCNRPRHLRLHTRGRDGARRRDPDPKRRLYADGSRHLHRRHRHRRRSS